MTRHAGAAVLLVGWLLMYPPLEDEAPVQESMRGWWHFKAFDTAKECEAHRERTGVTATPTAKDRSGKSGRCVPAEHVYPPRTTEAQ